MDLLVKPELTQEIMEAVKTLNLNLGIEFESKSAAQAVKWVAAYLITKEVLLFLAQVAIYVFLAWVAIKLGKWLAQTVKLWIRESAKVKMARDKARYREEILNRIDWERMQEALDAWYTISIKKTRKKKS
jgi:hypothetical protein